MLRLFFAFFQEMNLPELPFSFCIYCASLTRKEVGLCRICKIELQGKTKARTHFLNGHKIRSLFLWAQDQNPEVSKLVTSLKGGDNRNLWPWLVESFSSSHWNQIVNFLQSSVLVPVPSKRQTNQDHSFLFAQALGEKLKIPVGFAGYTANQESQKSKGRWARRLTRFKGTHNIPGTCTRAILVDDIVTTGATAQAVILHIEAQRKSNSQPALEWEIWTLAYRQHLASNKGIC